MKIETKLDLKRYLNLMYTLTYRKPGMIFLTILGVVAFFMSILYFLGFKMPFDNTPYPQLLFGLFSITIMPLSIYRAGKKNFTTHGKLQEKIVYDITDEKITLTGETFNSEMDWSKIYKIQELKKWILIYQSRQIANLIPKECFGDNLNEFRSLVRSKGVKAKLGK